MVHYITNYITSSIYSIVWVRGSEMNCWSTDPDRFVIWAAFNFWIASCLPFLFSLLSVLRFSSRFAADCLGRCLAIQSLLRRCGTKTCPHAVWNLARWNRSHISQCIKLNTDHMAWAKMETESFCYDLLKGFRLAIVKKCFLNDLCAIILAQLLESKPLAKCWS